MRWSDFNDSYFAIHINFSDDKKTFHAYTNPTSSFDTDMLNISDGVFDELNRFIEFDFRFISEYRKELKSIYDKVLNFDIDNTKALELFNEYINIFRNISKKIEKELPMLSHALNVFIDENQAIDNFAKFDFISPMDELWDELDGILILQRDLYMRFEELSQEQLNSQDRKNLPLLDDLGSFNINVELSYSNGEMKQIYLVNSAEILYSLLTSYFFASKPNISMCQNCNRFFLPKTKKVTLYCDRVTENGLTCKKVGAVSKYQNSIDVDPVLKKYNSEKHRIYMYCNRSKLDEYDFFDDYYDWLNIFEPKIKEYKAGNISADEVLDLLETKSKNFVPYSKDKHNTDW